ncbi:MAG: polyhydroxyalkanoic acid system family protein [Mariniblastus sp.]|nr:polyhydroxyalkanoic acid system family protein [Mariniblastus sp.]
MPKFNVVVAHEHDREHVVEQLKKFSQVIQQQSPVQLSNVTETWDDEGNLYFAFTAMSMSISGNMIVEETEVIVAGKMPLAAAMFRGAIENQIKEKVQEILGG